MKKWPITSGGVWRQYFRHRGLRCPSSPPILFLDRDGVLVEEVGYLHRVEDIRIYDQGIKLVSTANNLGWRVVIVTNQAGVGKGYYGWDEFSAVNDFIIRVFMAGGALIDGVLAVPHHQHGIGMFKVDDHPMRKPNPGMFFDATSHFASDPARCLVVGDRISDLTAGRLAGLRRGVLVLTGYGYSEVAGLDELNHGDFSSKVVQDLDYFPLEWLAG